MSDKNKHVGFRTTVQTKEALKAIINSRPETLDGLGNLLADAYIRNPQAVVNQLLKLKNP